MRDKRVKTVKNDWVHEVVFDLAPMVLRMDMAMICLSLSPEMIK